MLLQISIVMVPPCGMASRAFKHRFIRICTSWSASARIVHIGSSARPGRVISSPINRCQHIRCIVYQRVEAKNSWVKNLLAAEGEQLNGETSRAGTGVKDLLRIFVELFLCGYPPVSAR